MATLVCFHAHPDDESIATGGTMARAVAEGHRVVLVVATDGAAGLTSQEFQDDIAGTRQAEVEVSARALGVARTVTLGSMVSVSLPAPPLRTSSPESPSR